MFRDLKVQILENEQHPRLMCHVKYTSNQNTFDFQRGRLYSVGDLKMCHLIIVEHENVISCCFFKYEIFF